MHFVTVPEQPRFVAAVICCAASKTAAGQHQAVVSALPRGFGSMDSTVTCSDKSGRHILQDFLSKVLRLAANRLHDLCGRLDLQDANREDIETQVCSAHA